MTNRYEVPQATTSDAMAAYVKAGIQLVPGVGSAAVELFNIAIAMPLERRRDEWMREVAEGLREAEVNLETLGERQDFLDTFIQASTVALRTSNSDKRSALRNAVLNTATRSEPGEEERHLFLQLVDRFTPSHLRILKAFQDPPRAAGGRYKPALSSSLSAFLETALPDMSGRGDFYGLAWSDLVQAGLASAAGLNTMMTDRGWLGPRTTELGNRFLRFIERE